MSEITTRASRNRTFSGGLHPPQRKYLAADAPIEVLPTPSEVSIAMLQHLGAPCEATVKRRAEVNLGDVVGEAKAYVSAPVHASVSGTIMRASMATLPNGRHVSVIPIKASAKQPLVGKALFADTFGVGWPKDGQALFDDIFCGQWPTDNLEQYEPEQIAEAALWIATQDAGTFTGRSVNDDEVTAFIEGRARP